MKLTVLSCVFFVCVSGLKEDGRCEAPVFKDFWDVKHTFTEMRTSTECHLNQALRDVTSSAKAVISMTTDSGKKAINSLIAQFLIKVMSKTDDLKLFEGGLPDALTNLWNRESSFLRDTVKLSANFLRIRESEGTLAKVNFENLFWGAYSVGQKYEIKLPHWARDFVQAIQKLKSSGNYKLNLRVALDESIKLIPDSVLETMRNEYGLEQAEPEGKSFTVLESLNRKAIVILKFLGCKIAYTFGFPSACGRFAEMWDKFSETFTSSESQRSLSTMTVTEFLLDDSVSFPFHLFMGSNPTSTNITDFLATFISLRSDSDGNGSSEREKRRDGSSRFLSDSQQFDVESLFLGWNAYKITGFVVDLVLAFFSAIAKFESRGIVPPPTPARDVFAEYVPTEDQIKGNLQKRFVAEHMEVFNVLVKCFDQEWYNDIFYSYFPSSSVSTSHMTLEKRITMNLDQLAEHRDALADALVPHILDHINSGNENIKLAPKLSEYLDCIEDSLGPLHEWQLISKVRGVSELKSKLVETFDIIDIDLSEIIGILRKENDETKLRFTKNNVRETFEIINTIWSAYKYTKSNASCFGSEVCQCYNKEINKQTWLPQLVRISGLTMELLRGLEEYDWKNLPRMLEIFINGEETCLELGDEKCTYHSLLSLIYSFLVRILPEPLIAQLAY